MRYTVIVAHEDDAYVVRVPSLPGCLTQGRTVSEALDFAREAIAGHIAALHDLGEPIPMEAEAPVITAIEIAEPAA